MDGRLGKLGRRFTKRGRGRSQPRRARVHDSPLHVSNEGREIREKNTSGKEDAKEHSGMSCED